MPLWSGCGSNSGNTVCLTKTTPTGTQSNHVKSWHRTLLHVVLETWRPWLFVERWDIGGNKFLRVTILWISLESCIWHLISWATQKSKWLITPNLPQVWAHPKSQAESTSYTTLCDRLPSKHETLKNNTSSICIKTCSPKLVTHYGPMVEM